MDTPNTFADFKGLTDWVEVFRAGQQTDSLGRKVNFSRSDLDELVTNLSAEVPPPHVITHKELYSPFRFGDVVEAKRDGDSLFVRSDKIDPSFEKLVEEGRLPDRSVRITRSDDGYQLAHVAWLGAEPPAVEGMAPVQFAASSENVFDFSLQEVRATGLLARMMRRMREFLIEEHGIEKADRVMPDYEVETADDLHVDARTSREDTPDTVSSFAAPNDPDEGEPGMGKEMTAEQQADFEATKTENAELKAKLEAQAHQQRVSEFQAEVTKAIDAGKVTPAQTEGMAEFMASLSDADNAAFEFSAGDATAKKSPVAWFNDFIASLGKQIDLDESDAGSDLPSGGAVEFSTQPGYQVNPEKLAQHQKALDYQREHPGTEYIDAVQAVGG